MNSLHTLETWPLPAEQPWSLGIFAGILCLFLSGVAIPFVTTLWASLFAGVSTAVIVSCTALLGRQEIRRVKLYRQYRQTHARLAAANPQRFPPTDRQSKAIMLDVLRKDENHAAR